MTAWLAAQNGAPASAQPRFEAQPRYICNGRVLGEWAHRNFSYQSTLIAALILLDYVQQFGGEVLDEANPYRGSSTQVGFVTFGAPHVLDLVARVANPALKAAWYQKWVVHRRLRPEEFGGRIHHHMTGAAQYPIHAKLFNSPALAAVFSQHGTYLCPQAYPEGCPTHPAYPGGQRDLHRRRRHGAQGLLQRSVRDPEPGRPKRGRPVAAAVEGGAVDRRP